MPRLFVAVDLPDKLTKELVRLRGEMSGARWVRKEQLHLTLRFIGEKETDALVNIKTGLSEINYPSFTLGLTGIGYFISNGKVRVIWAGVRDNEYLRQLKQKIDQALREAGIPPEKRRFSPHITLARLNYCPLKKVKDFLDKHKSFTSSMFTVSEFHLYSTASRGAVHQKEFSCKLEGHPC
ncbi:MAG: RNA 2',3'-cyclic phosphodiesterase [bacterium]